MLSAGDKLSLGKEEHTQRIYILAQDRLACDGNELQRKIYG